MKSKILINLIQINIKNLKYQKYHTAYSYGYKLVCVDDKFSKPFKSYLGENISGRLY